MKILQLNLMAFGPFTDERLDLSEGSEGLHIIYGLNEAGKSSALRALRQLLYGIPERSSDDFRHPYSKMRIGGMLQTNDGGRIEIIRRKGRAHTLRTGDDSEPLSQALLEDLLGHVDGDVFATMFAIDHTDLVRGGEALMQGGGEVGQALFSAGAGISDLQKIREALHSEAEALFTPTASKKPINEAIKAIKANQKELRNIQLPGQEWQRHDEALRQAERHRGELGLSLEQKDAQRHRLGRIQEALPLAASRTTLLEEMKPYADAVVLPDDFGERRRELFADLRIAEATRDQAQDALKAIDKSMQGLTVSGLILEAADQIEQVHKELGSFQKALSDRIQLQTRRDILQEEAMAILSGLRDDMTLDEVEGLRLKKSETIRIQRLGAQYERLMTRNQSAREDLEKLSRHIAQLKEVLKAAQNAHSVDDLKKVHERALKYEALEEQCAAEETDIRRSQKALMAEFTKQTFWSGTLEALERLSFPAIETIDHMDARLQSAENRVSQIGSDIEGSDALAVDIEGQIRELELEQEVPTEEDLLSARQQRDMGWGLVRTILDTGKAPEEDTRAFLRLFDPADTLADAYETAVRTADEISDRLRREADRVAKKARLLADRETRERHLARLRRNLEDAEHALTGVQDAWRDLWDRVGISPRTPREMRAWVQDQRAITQKFLNLQDRIQKATALRSQIEQQRGEMGSALAAISESAEEATEGLSDLILRARRAIEQNEAIRFKREQLIREIEQGTYQQRDLESRVEQIQRDISQWQMDWAVAIRPLGLEKDATPEQASTIMEDVKDLFEKRKDAEILHKRVKGIDKDAAVFSQKVMNLAQYAAPELKTLPIEQAVTELNAALTHARTAQSERRTLEKQRQQEAGRLSEAETSIAAIKSRLDAMCEEAACSDYAALKDAEHRSITRRQMETKLRDLDDQLLRLSAGSGIERLLKEIHEVDPDGIEAQITRLSHEMDALEEERSRLDQTIGEEKNELSRMDGSARAADLAEETQGIMARVGGEILTYARLRIASAVLSKFIERYREEHQGPVLKRASDLFRRLTLESFEGIRVDVDPQGNPVLVGIRSSEKDMVSVNGMSDGTTDQLYLALRLASLETYLDHNPSMPFIVDDIMIKFDDNRAAAALQVLADLSKRTQVIVFTHHQHLVDLADASIDPSLLFKHTLHH